MGDRLFRVRGRRRAAVLGALALLATGLGVPGDSARAAEHTYPDLQPHVTELYTFDAWVEDPETGEFHQVGKNLGFDTHSRNLGTVPVELMADDVTDLSGSTVSQCVSWDGPLCQERETVGGFTWHDEHTHFHYEDFATYELRRLVSTTTTTTTKGKGKKSGSGTTLERGKVSSSGKKTPPTTSPPPPTSNEPDWSPAGLISISEKVSFCLVDSVQVDPAASPAPRYAGCPHVLQGISPGWADIYTSDLEGQTLFMGYLPDGKYAMVVKMDTSNTLHETNDDNNRLVTVIELKDNGATVEIVSQELK